MMTAPFPPHPAALVLCSNTGAGLRVISLHAAKVPGEEDKVAELRSDGRLTADMFAALMGAKAIAILLEGHSPSLTRLKLQIRIAAMLGIPQLLLAMENPAELAGPMSELRQLAATLGFAESAVRLVPQAVKLPAACPAANWFSKAGLTALLPDPVGSSTVTEHRLAAEPGAPPEIAHQFEARLLCVGENALAPGRQYKLRLAGREVAASINQIKYQEDPATGAHLAARTLSQNMLARVTLETAVPVAFEPFRANHALGSFALVDQASGETLACGILEFALRRASNIHWQALELNKAVRAAQKHQVPKCIWFTGLSGAGKTMLANQLDKRLHAAGRHTYLLDGDNVRHGLNRDLGFTEADRVENIRRVAEVARLMVDAGLIVLVSFISPFRSERRMARELFADGEFIEVFVDTPIEVCERRDVKGLYAKARRGELKNFTGIDSPYEAPLAPEVWLDTAATPGAACVDRILELLGAAPGRS